MMSSSEKKDDQSFLENVPETEVTYTAEKEGKIKQKMDMYLLPIISLMYLMSYLDRSNSKSIRLDLPLYIVGLTNEKENSGQRRHHRP